MTRVPTGTGLTRPGGALAKLRTGPAVAALLATAIVLTDGMASLTPGPETGQAALALGITVLVALLTGRLASKVGQPRVIGEIVGGILLGPSAFGLAWPQAQSWLFTSETVSQLQPVAELGLMFFVFLVGLHIERDMLRGRHLAIVSVSQASVVLPFAVGAAVAVVLPPALVPTGTARTFFVFFLGIAFSVTAFPVLARILADRGLFGTQIGFFALACAAVIDLAAWLGIALLTGLVRAEGAGTLLLAAGGAAGLTVLLLFVVRPLLRTAADRRVGQRLLAAAALVGVPCVALAAEHVGLHLLIGAFLLGVAFPRNTPTKSGLWSELDGALTTILLPPFFALVGLRTDLGALSAHASLWAWTGLLLVVAVLSKIVGTAVGARVAGFGWQDSATLGVLLSCRGLTELVILDIGRSLGLLTPTLFSMLVIVATLSTVLTGPLLGLVGARSTNVHLRQTQE